jgi:hypothetical protein
MRRSNRRIPVIFCHAATTVETSVNANVAGTGFRADGGAAAVDFSGDVVAVERSLHRHFGVAVDGSGTG